MKTSYFLKLAIFAGLAVLVAGCEEFGRGSRTHQANSLYNYLYASQTGHVDNPAIPVLSLPLRVGIAFVPADRPKGGGNVGGEDAGLTEVQKLKLMRRIGDEFKRYPFIKSIEIIPSTYLTPRGGFANLAQLQTIYGIDEVMLLSCDQAQFSDNGLLSLSYWTIVGAYVVRGEKNDTQTMLDGAVYDIASRKLLFRAPGLSQVKGSATPINQSEELRLNRERGFNAAATNLTASLQAGLADFQERVKNSPEEFKVIHKPGYTGGGAADGWDVALIAGMGAGFLWLRRRGQP